MGVSEISATYDIELAGPAAVLPQGCKLTELGVIPSEWEVKEVHEFAGIMTGPFGTLLKAAEYSTGDGVPVISVGEVRDGYFRVTEHTPRVSDVVTKRLRQYVLKEGDVVFGRKGGVERSALIRREHDGWFLGSDGIRIRPSRDLAEGYLAFQFQSNRVQSWLLQHAIGTTMPSLNQEVLRQVAIPLPPTRVEQEAIAEALSDTDALIESLEQLIAKKRQIKQGTMQALLTGKQRLPGFNDEWHRCYLADLVAFHKGKGLPKSALDAFAKTPCIHYGELFTKYAETIREVTSYTGQVTDALVSYVQDVLMPTSDVTPTGLAKASCVTMKDVVIGGDILVIRPDTSRLYGPFLSYVIRYSKQQIMQLVTGSTVFHIYATDMKKFTLAVPSIKEQEQIIRVLDDMDTEIAELETRLAKTRQLKQGMMQELLTGRIRLV